MLLNKKVHVISLVILIMISTSILLYILLPLVFMSEEERFLNKFMGGYIVADYAFAVSPELLSSPYSEDQYKAKSRYYFDEQRFVGLHNIEPVINSYNVIDINDPVNYTCIKIDDSFLENGIQTQGIALRKLFQSNSEFHEQVKDDAFAIFIETPATTETYPEYKDEIVFYYIDGRYFAIDTLHAYVLEKI